MRVLVPQHRDVEAPVAVDERFQQELNHALFLQMLAHHLRRLLASAGGGFADGANSGEDLIMAANVIIHRRDINSHQTADALRGGAVNAITALPPIEWPIKVARSI